jgi:DNA polymerase-3 subunit chi
MTQVDFYILDERAEGNRYTFACRLAEKIYLQGRRTFIHTTSVEEQRHMDRLLWTYRQGSFVPHSVLEKADPEVNPVIIGCSAEAGEESDVLINLAPEAPDFFSRFERVAEIIDRDADIKAAGRTRYRFYRDRGYPLNTHDIK